MATELKTPQAIPNTFDEATLLALSMAQNGAARLETVRDDQDTRKGFLSHYQIDLSTYAAQVIATNAQGLATYAEAKAQSLIASGFTYTFPSGATGPRVALADTDIAGRVNLNGLVSLAQLNPNFTTIWVQPTGNLQLDAADILALGPAVGQFVADVYGELAVVLGAIANQAITTTQQIDASAWPATHN